MKTLLISLLLCGVTANVMAKTLSVSSPDQQIEVIISDELGFPSYQVKFQQQSIVQPSRLGLRFLQTVEFGEGFHLTTSQQSTVKQHWQQPWGEQEWIDDHHNQLSTTLSNGRYQFQLIFRVYNDGIGFRYLVPKQTGLTTLDIIDELTEFRFNAPEQATAWWIPSRGWNRYEYLYKTTALSEVTLAHTPFTFKLPTGVHISIHEAALVDYAGMSLQQGRHGVFKADLAPWSDGILVKTHAGFKTPWRTIQMSSKATGLINSALILNLNEPNQLGDVSWVEPGKYVGIWWGMHIGETTWSSGKNHGATTKETKRYMDFAAKYGFKGVLVEGWNIGWDGEWFNNGDLFHFTQSFDDFDLKAVTDYGRQLGVQLIGHHETSGNVTNYRRQMDAAYQLYQQHGVHQVKTGYVADGKNIKRIDEQGIARYEWHDGQFMVNEYLHSVKTAANYHIAINTHEPIKDTGLRRTYPNWLSREGARGQEYNAWGKPPNPPEHTTLLPYTRLLAGPMDFTPGIFNMNFNGLSADVSRPQTTLAKQLALYVIIYSPIQMAADLPRNYEKNLAAFQFIRDVPTDWAKSQAIAGEVGDYIVMARQDRHSNDWFLGAITDENKRTISLPLHFLQPNTQYQAQIYRDGNNANWLDHPDDMIIEQQRVNTTTKLTVNLAPSGGVAIRFKALNEPQPSDD
jgi:alpha-glucosidase